ncbi:anacyclamide/piricyclamide family prenylated cyclic peptide [Moorena producens JHB]|uniref:Anacyclamide/piricyclamide family prenylated cyclic peptide n=1 Tax=Moorena producens (strain JHB) TaxID=1454205 RepID=A0A1D9G302_MOOP1|nr:anacyclamide/piricyclamide family prenylated cyclic peptide [Moorena producens]AOY81983.1 anacyclamide/piricyclamide family prenylated cyclic peptide [Moorena producens JHB]
MKVKNLNPRQTAPVKRENITTVTVAVDGNAIAPSTYCDIETRMCTPFASDGAE